MHGGWSTEPHGARNYHQSEYDSCLYFLLIVGLPVYWSFRGCVHVIEINQLRPGERLERLRGFPSKYLGLSVLPGRILFPLRVVRRLKRLILYELGLGLSGCMAFITIVIVLAVWQRPFNRWKQDDLILIGVCAAAGAPFVPGLIAYL